MTSTKKRRLASGLGVNISRCPRWAISVLGSFCMETESIPRVLLKQMSRSCAKFPRGLRSQPDIDFFERSEESHEGAAQMGRRTPGTPEIAMAELVGRGNHRAAHGTVFMGAPRPRQ